MNLKIGYNYKVRIDPYRDYYTYFEPGVNIAINYKITPTIVISSRCEYALRKYKIRLVPSISGPKTQLSKKYFDFYFNISYRIFRFLNLYFRYIINNRDTNVEQENWTIYRDYKNNILLGGLQLYF